MAITVEFGKCTQCNDNNPKQLQMCRKCDAPLPWAKAPKPQYSRAAASPSRAAAKDPVQVDWGLWGVNFLAFAAPIIGFFLYRSYSENGDSKADTVLIWSIVGVVAHLARFGIRMMASAA